MTAELGDIRRGVVPARLGRAVQLDAGQTIRVVNTHGTQVVDTWAFHADDPGECMSMEHTRAMLQRVMPQVGEAFLTNHRRSILTVVDDTSPGVHDTLNAACDVYRYRLMGVEGYHDNCTDNLRTALREVGIELPGPWIPGPFNMFMNRRIEDGGMQVKRLPPVSKPGDSYVMRAELPCIIVFSACPQDIDATNGPDCIPRDVHWEIVEFE